MLTIAAMLERQAARHGRTVALIDEPSGETWTIADLERCSASAAAALQASGVTRGDRVGLLSENHPSMVITYLAVARLGAVLVPFNWRLTGPELETIAADAGIVALVANHAMAETANGLARSRDIGADRLLWIGDDLADAEGTVLDVGVVDDEGFLTIRDRLKDMLISGGENVYPAEVESVLLRHPSIADVAVFGIDSEQWGESPVAVIVAAGEVDLDEVTAWSREHLATYKIPTQLKLVEELPRNAAGKVLKHELRATFASN